MDDFTVADVYEHAAKIGQDMEQLIRDYGEKSVEEIMPKIVFTLEQLEGLAERRQKDVAVINDLNGDKEKLLIECKREAALRRQAEEKVDYLQDLLNEDKQTLQTTISKLTEENQMLKCEVEQLDEEVLHQRTEALPGDVDLMMKMKSTIDMQRDQLRHLTMQDETQKNEIEALSEQTSRLTEMNERLRLYNTKLQDRLIKTVEHKVQAEATLASVQIVQNEEKQIVEEDKHRIEEEKEGIEDGKQSSEDSSKVAREAENTIENGEDVLATELSQKVNMDSEPKTLEANKDRQMVTDEKDKTNEVSVQNKDINSNGNKKKDPNRPRYTLFEMQQVLEERNRFKERVNMLEDVLEAYLPGPIRSSTLDASDVAIKTRKASTLSEGRNKAKKESKVRGIFGLFYKDSSGK